LAPKLRQYAGHTGIAVGAGVVHHHEVAGAERRAESVLEKSHERIAVGPALEGHHRFEAASEVQSTDHRGHGSAVPRHVVDGAFPARRSAVHPRHRDVRASFIDEDQARRIYGSLPGGPRFTKTADTRGVGFGGDEGLFFRVHPRRAIARLIEEALTAIPVSSQKMSASSSFVASRCCPRIRSRTSSRMMSIFGGPCG
jgi:hypothetical protein